MTVEQYMRLCQLYMDVPRPRDGHRGSQSPGQIRARVNFRKASSPELIWALLKCFQDYQENDWARNAGKVSNDNLDRVDKLLEET